MLLVHVPRHRELENHLHLLRHGAQLKDKMLPNGGVVLGRSFDCLGNRVSPLQQFTDGRLFASFLNGNNKQRFFVELALKSF